MVQNVADWVAPYLRIRRSPPPPLRCTRFGGNHHSHIMLVVLMTICLSIMLHSRMKSNLDGFRQNRGGRSSIDWTVQHHEPGQQRAMVQNLGIETNLVIANAKYTYLDGPLTTRIAFVGKETLLFISLVDKHGYPCVTHGAYSVVVTSAINSVTIRPNLKDYESSSTITYGITVGHEHIYTLSVLFGAVHVVGSPFQFNAVTVYSRQIPSDGSCFSYCSTAKKEHLKYCVPRKLWGISDTPIDSILVANRGTNDIHEFEYDLTLKRVINAGFNQPSKAIFVLSDTHRKTIVVADSGNLRVVMIDYESKELLAKYAVGKRPLDLCVAGENGGASYILVTHSKCISVLNFCLIHMFDIQSPDIESPRGICRGYLDHILVSDFNTSVLVVLKIKSYSERDWAIVNRVYLKNQNNPDGNVTRSVTRSVAKTMSEGVPVLQGVTLDKGSGCILVCDKRGSVNVFSYSLQYFTHLEQVKEEAMGVIAIKDKIYFSMSYVTRECEMEVSSVEMLNSVLRGYICPIDYEFLM